MLKGFIVGVVATVIAAVVAAYVAVTAGAIPANGDAHPGRLERWAARASLHATLARESTTLQNPLPADEPTLLAGVKIYAQHCEICHSDSSGRPTYVGFGLYQHAPLLGRHGAGDDPDGEIYWKVTHGIRWTGMPSFGKTLSDTQRWQVVTFLKHMDALPPKVEAVWKKTTVPVVPESLLPRRRPGEKFP